MSIPSPNGSASAAFGGLTHAQARRSARIAGIIFVISPDRRWLPSTSPERIQPSIPTPCRTWAGGSARSAIYTWVLRGSSPKPSPSLSTVRPGGTHLANVIGLPPA
jgi:hypothetical protein